MEVGVEVKVMLVEVGVGVGLVKMDNSKIPTFFIKIVFKPIFLWYYFRIDNNCASKVNFYICFFFIEVGIEVKVMLVKVGVGVGVGVVKNGQLQNSDIFY